MAERPGLQVLWVGNPLRHVISDCIEVLQLLNEALIKETIYEENNISTSLFLDDVRGVICARYSGTLSWYHNSRAY